VNFSSSFGGGNISVIASNECGSANGSLPVTGAPATPSISGATSVCANDVENYTAAASGATGFNWSVDPLEGNMIPTGNPNEILVEWITNGGIVSVTASNSCGTSGIANLTVGSSCRISGNSNMADILKASVFPNPSHGNMTLQFNSPEKSDYLLKVTDLTGRVVYTEKLSGAQGVNQHELEMSHLAKGMYKFSIENSSGETVVLKVIID
jgi:hypothetical protein